MKSNSSNNSLSNNSLTGYISKSRFYVSSMNELKQTKTMVLLAFFAAIGIILGYTTTLELGPFIKISFAELANRMVDFIFGPVIGGIFGGVLDILKYLVKPTGPFFAGFTISAIVSGILFGSILYKKPVRLYRIIIAEIIEKTVVNIILNTWWLSILYGKGFMVLLTARIIKNLILLPIDCILLFILLTYMDKIIKKVMKK